MTSDRIDRRFGRAAKSDEKAPFGECPGCAGMGWHLPVTCGLDDEQADYIVCTVCGNPQNSPRP